MSENQSTRAESARTDREMLPSKAAVTRSAILDAGHEFLETRPFRDLTVGKLMAQTQYSRPTFYLYFNDLHGFMEAVLDEVKGGIVDGARAWLSNEGDSVSGLQQSLKSLVDVAYEHGPILKSVADAAASDARLEHVWESFLGSFDELVSARIAQDQHDGITPEFDPRPVARALNRMDAAVLIHAFGKADRADKDAVLASILRIWLSTLYPFDVAATIGRRG